MDYPVIPETITVHLGAPGQDAENVTLPFIDYVKNVASGEIYPTWPEQALRANILAQISFALNRVYTEWYPSQGYDFDITSLPQYDQSFDPGREVFANISALADELFRDYVVRGDSIVPYFTRYCNGTTSTCPGLSQWGTVELAEQGMSALEILRYYYGDDIRVVEDAETGDNLPSFPGKPLQPGDISEEVRTIQRELNRIAGNFPSIPTVEVGIGIYDEPTAAAVSAYQALFDLPVTGVVDETTWYSIKRRYVAVKGLADLVSEGLRYSEIDRMYPDRLAPGDSGLAVRLLQHYLDLLAFFDTELQNVKVSGVFDEATAEALRYFEEIMGLPVDGVVDIPDWAALTAAYRLALSSLPAEYQEYAAKIYPGYFLNPGREGEAVTALQQAINRIAAFNADIYGVAESGVYDEDTQDAVRTLQMQAGLPATGSVGPLTWAEIIGLSYNM